MRLLARSKTSWRRRRACRDYITIDGFSLLTRVSTTNSAFYFVDLKPWSERTKSSLESEAILANINRQLFAQVPEAVAFAFDPPAIPGFGNAGGFSLWLQDRSGGSVDDLDRNLQKFLQAARKRPELVGVNSQFSAADAADLRHRGSRQGAEAGRGAKRCVSDAASFAGRAVRESIQPLRPAMESVPRSGSGGSLFTSHPSRNITCATMRARWCHSQLSSPPDPTNGPDYTNRFNLYRAAQVIGSAAPGYSSGQAQAALEEVARETLPASYGLRLGRPLVSGK